MKEIWKDIPDFAGYQISNLGRIKSFLRYKNGKILKPQIGTTGYYSIVFRANMTSIRIHIHRLVGLIFIDKLPNTYQINHKDGNKLNNNSKNLEWVTDSGNRYHAYEHQLRKCFDQQDVFQILFLRKQNIKVTKIAKIFNVHKTTIYRLLKGTTYPYRERI